MKIFDRLETKFNLVVIVFIIACVSFTFTMIMCAVKVSDIDTKDKSEFVVDSLTYEVMMKDTFISKYIKDYEFRAKVLASTKRLH